MTEELVKAEKTTTRQPISDQSWWDEIEYEQKRSLRNVKPVTQQDIEFYNMVKNIQVIDPRPGAVVSGKYIGMQGQDYIFFFEGFKDHIRVENKPNEEKYIENIQKGDSVDILIYDVDRKNFEIKGSISQLFETMVHKELSEDSDVIVMAKVNSMNPAGYDITLEYNNVEMSAFMPNTLAGINKLHDAESIVGQKFEVMVESYSESEGTYIVSRRKYLKTLMPKELDKLMTNTLYQGHVTGTTPFGVFVEFNRCLTGMIHKANIVEEYRDKIQDIRPGQKIEFYVKEIIKNNKIILTQILRETLWDNIEVGQSLSGIVKDVKPFGALVVLDSETIGLVHSSEIEKNNLDISNGSQVSVKVLRVDRGNRKIFLTVE